MPIILFNIQFLVKKYENPSINPINKLAKKFVVMSTIIFFFLIQNSNLIILRLFQGNN